METSGPLKHNTLKHNMFSIVRMEPPKDGQARSKGPG
jgi:hypothetical protein